MTNLMYDFQMAAWRVERANDHIDHLKKIIEWTVDPENYLVSPEKDFISDTYQLRVGPRNGGLPRHLPIVMGEVVHGLTAALDYIWSGLARSVVPTQANRAHFPRHETRKNLEDMVAKAPVVIALPKAGDLILDTLRPYKDGNFALWAIGKLDNIDKHRLLLSCVAVAKLGKFVATSEDGGVIDLSNCTINSSGPALSLGFATPFKLNSDMELVANIVFEEPDVIPPGQPVLATLVDFSETTTKAIDAFKEAFL